MKRKEIILCVCLLAFLLQGLTQTINRKVPAATFTRDTAMVNSLILQSKNLFGDAPEKAIQLSMQAKDLAAKIGYEKGLAGAFKSIGIGYYNQGKYMEALDNWKQSLQVFETIKDDVGIANLLSNIGAIYKNQGDDEKALDYALRSLKVAERTGDTLRIVTAMNNVGAVYYHKKETHDKAIPYYLKALQLSEKIKDDYGIGTTAVNLGEIYFERKKDSLALVYFNKSLQAYRQGSPESVPYSLNAIGKVYASKGKYVRALAYHTRALTISNKLNAAQDKAQSLLGIASTYEKQGNLADALTHYQQAEKFANESNSLHELQLIYEGLANVYSDKLDFKNAFKYQTLFTDVKSKLYNIEADKKLASMQFDFDLQKKQGEIDLLTKDKSLRDLEIKRQKLARRALTVGLVLVFFIAFMIYRDNRIKVRTNKILDGQKVQIENLLLNILPSEVAKELQVNGHATPRSYQQVSVLFSDFKGFSAIAEKMSPEELVKDLNDCFMALDAIIEKYGLEKIKTIGDSYMCAGGIPSPDISHPFLMVKAALEIQDYMQQYNRQRGEHGREPMEMRIGIHVGPVVAGVVGRRKYAYDIWGNTVNIASRMESSGAPGKVNISAATYELIKEKFICSYRGKIYAKNVGEIDMYFVECELDKLVRTKEVKQTADNETFL